jgi:AAA family ATP:ADP antiporter
MSVSDNGLNYSINQSAREALYTPTSQDAKYKAKAFIDMFIQRAAKVLAVVLNLGLTAVAFLEVRWLSLVVLGLIVGWAVLIHYLGDAFEEQKGEDAPVLA